MASTRQDTKKSWRPISAAGVAGELGCRPRVPAALSSPSLSPRKSRSSEQSTVALSWSRRAPDQITWMTLGGLVLGFYQCGEVFVLLRPEPSWASYRLDGYCLVSRSTWFCSGRRSARKRKNAVCRCWRCYCCTVAHRARLDGWFGACLLGHYCHRCLEQNVFERSKLAYGFMC